MKKNLIISLAILLAVSASGAGSYVYAKMSPEAYKLFQETTVLEKENNYTAAIENIKKAIEISPDEAILYIKLGGIYSESGDWQNALVAYKKAIKLKPNDAVVYISSSFFFYYTIPFYGYSIVVYPFTC